MVIGVYLFGTVITPMQIGGLVVCIAGALTYAVEKKSKTSLLAPTWAELCGGKRKGPKRQ